MEGAANGKTFKMKGHTLPGISQAKSSNKSSTFQRGIGDYEGKGSFNLQVDPMMNPAMAAQPVQQVPTASPMGTPFPLINISFQGSTGKTKTKTTDKSRRKWKNTGNTGCPDPDNPNCP